MTPTRLSMFAIADVVGPLDVRIIDLGSGASFPRKVTNEPRRLFDFDECSDPMIENLSASPIAIGVEAGLVFAQGFIVPARFMWSRFGLAPIDPASLSTPSTAQGATPNPVASGVADVQGVAAAANLRLVGWSITEDAAAAAVARLRLHHGTSAAGPELFDVELLADESAREWFDEQGIAVPDGVFVDRVLGTTRLTLYSRVAG